MLAPLFKVGIHVLEDSHPLKQAYDRTIEHSGDEMDERNRVKTHFVFRHEHGFELFSTTTEEPLDLIQQSYLYQKSRELAYAMKLRVDRYHRLAQPLRITAASATRPTNTANAA